MNSYTDKYGTGNAAGFLQARPVTEKEKVELWFIEPLCEMKGDEAFACLMILFPLLETIIRFELGIPDDQDATFADGSKELHVLLSSETNHLRRRKPCIRRNKQPARS